MKILHVSSFFKPSWEAGGAVRTTYEISRSLVQNGHDVTVYTTDGFSHRLNVEKNTAVFIDGIKTYYFKNLSLYLTKNMNLPIPYNATAVIKRNIKDFDVVHINGYRTFLAVVTHYYAVKYNIPYVLQPNGTVPFLGKKNQKKVFDYFFGNSLVKDAKTIIVSSKLEASYYPKMFPDLDLSKIICIPEGINVENYYKLPEKGVFKEKYSIAKNDMVILFLGRIHEIKGLTILIEAYSDLLKSYDNVKLVIVGPDEGYLEKLKVLIANSNLENNVIFTGPIYEHEKTEAYIDADVFVLPSMYDSFGIVVLEALACGKPVIVTDRCGVSDFVENEVGFVVEYDKAHLFKALNALLSDEGLRERFGENGIKLVNNLSLTKIICRFENIYNNLI